MERDIFVTITNDKNQTAEKMNEYRSIYKNVIGGYMQTEIIGCLILQQNVLMYIMDKYKFKSWSQYKQYVIFEDLRLNQNKE